MTNSGLWVGLGLKSFFASRNAEPIVPMMAAQPSPEMLRAEGIWVAAGGGHARAQCWLGYCYQRGDGIAQDMAEGVRWFQRAARRGEMTAEYNLGICFEGGLGVSKDRDQMISCYRKAADQGHLEAHFRLGVHYTTIPHTRRFGANAATREGLKWLEQAAEKGHTKSQLQLGHLHSLPGGEIVVALKWYLYSRGKRQR